MKCICITGVAFLFILLSSKVIFTGEEFLLNTDLLRNVENQYGRETFLRLKSWEQLIQSSKNISELQKIERVNQFFNRMIFVNDFDLWGVNDYWATPIEFLIKGAGDCEDFAIAKYFTLKALGVPDTKLNIAYVKALQYNMPHVVLIYYQTPTSEPLVLDNLIDSVEFASKRTDLIPIFSFNGTGLWLAHRRGQGKLAGSSSRIVPWQELMMRMDNEKLRLR